MPDYELRPAAQTDCRTIAELYSVASDGVADYVWSKAAAAGEDPLDVGQRRYEREDSVFSYRNTTVVQHGDEIVGMLVAFPMIVDQDYVEEDPVLAPYSELEEPHSYYICAMAVVPEHRGRGIGRRLLELGEARAREDRRTRLSLIVFERNSGARRLYERAGFVEPARAEVVPHPLIHHEGFAILMVKELCA